MSDSAKLEKTITHYNASKVLMAVVLILVNIATISLLIYSTLLLVDCTTPQGECAKRSQSRTNELLRQIARHDEATTFCANKSGVDTRAKLTACIEKEMATK